MGRPTDVPADFEHLPVSIAEQSQPLETGDLVAELCRRLGVRPDCTAEIRISPFELWVWTRVYDLNDEGRKHATGTGDAAESVTRWSIRTTIPDGDGS